MNTSPVTQIPAKNAAHLGGIAPRALKVVPKDAAAAAALSRGWALGGRYDAIFSLADSFLGQVRDFFGLGGAFPSDQLVARSATGKSVIFLAPALLALLRSDVQTKLDAAPLSHRSLFSAQAARLPFQNELQRPCHG